MFDEFIVKALEQAPTVAMMWYMTLRLEVRLGQCLDRVLDYLQDTRED